MLGRSMFLVSIFLNLTLLGFMAYRQFWRHKPLLCTLQLLLFLETPLFVFASPALYAAIWPMFDQYDILIVLAYIISCGRDCWRFRMAANLLIFSPLLKLVLWCDLISDAAYTESPLHYARILIDLAATIVLIWAVNSYAGKETNDARSNQARETRRAESSTAATPA